MYVLIGHLLLCVLVIPDVLPLKVKALMLFEVGSFSLVPPAQPAHALTSVESTPGAKGVGHGLWT